MIERKESTMDTILIQYLQASPILAKYHLSAAEINELAVYLRKNCIASKVEEVVRMVEEIISINPALDWKEILEAAAKKIVSLSPRRRRLYPYLRPRDRQACCFRFPQVL